MQKSGIFTKIKTAIINGGLDLCILYNHTRVYYILDAI